MSDYMEAPRNGDVLTPEGECVSAHRECNRLSDTIESLQAERKELLDLLERGWDCRNRDCVNGKIPLREVAGEQDFITCNDCAKRDELLKKNSYE